jgi:F-type H+-transporting ATPase subunit delta
MMVRRFARPYARAIMDVAGSASAAAAVQSELAQFEVARRTSSDLREVFANPGIDVDAKIAIANQIAERLSLSAPARKVLEVLIRNHRMNDLGAISAALASYVNDATNTVVAEVRTAHTLTAPETAALQQTLEKKFGKRVEVQLTADPALMGGFVARVGSEIYDASVAGKIEKFRESLA